MTIVDLAREALDVQNGSNLSGVVHSFSRAMTSLRRLEPDHDTDWYNHHPISQMFASKIHDLSGLGLSEAAAFSNAYDRCVDLGRLDHVVNLPRKLAQWEARFKEVDSQEVNVSHEAAIIRKN